jgi:hypothetical protein
MNNPISYAVVGILGVFALAGLCMTWNLIGLKAEGSDIAIISGLTGTALGAVGSILNRTHSDNQSQPVVVTNSDAQPVPTTAQDPPTGA